MRREDFDGNEPASDGQSTEQFFVFDYLYSTFDALQVRSVLAPDIFAVHIRVRRVGGDLGPSVAAVAAVWGRHGGME